jgi:hypothetical protein
MIELEYEMTYAETIEGPLGPTDGSPLGERLCWQVTTDVAGARALRTDRAGRPGCSLSICGRDRPVENRRCSGRIGQPLLHSPPCQLQWQQLSKLELLQCPVCHEQPHANPGSPAEPARHAPLVSVRLR